MPPATRRIFTNRTLNLRSIQAVGFDMDYTLIHYRTAEWESRAYEHAKERLLSRGWPVHDLRFDFEFATLGLILDLELGNVVKANRFGYVKKATHGTKELGWETYRELYARTVVDLSSPRWRFMNTLFALSEATLYAQCIDLLEQGHLDDLGEGPMGYGDVYAIVRSAINEAHMMGELKAEIVAEPERFVELDEELALALMDLRHAGKKTVLITNSEWGYTKAMMSYAFDRFAPESSWRKLFDLVIVAARKPVFFEAESPIFRIVDEEKGLLEPVVPQRMKQGEAYLGGHAWMVESLFDLSGEQILYVGDHIFSDVNVSKKMHRWRTALVVRELEQDLRALEEFREEQEQLSALMDRKEHLEHALSTVRMAIQRKERGYGPPVERSKDALVQQKQALRQHLVALDAEIAPLAQRASQLANRTWGLLMRAGNDKSHLARQIEKNADVYTSRVSNLLVQTPFVYLRSTRSSLPHDL